MAILPKLFGKKLEPPLMPAKHPPQVRDGRSASDMEELREEVKNRQVTYKLENENNPLFGKEKGHSLEVDEGAIAAKKAAAAKAQHEPHFPWYLTIFPTPLSRQSRFLGISAIALSLVSKYIIWSFTEILLG